MDNRILYTSLAAASAVALLSATLPASARQEVMPSAPGFHAAMPAEQMQNGIPYLAGGVGIDARNYMARAAGQYNLRLSFAASGNRHYVPDVRVTISAPDNRRMLVLNDAGPLLYAKLPKGRYRVDVLYHGITKSRMISVDGGIAQAHFLWQNAPAGLS